MMCSKLSILLVVLLGLQISQAFLWFNKYLKSDYDKLNEYLVETVPSEEIESNLEQLRKWLRETEIPGPFKKVDKSMSKAINQILALQEVDQKCDHDGFVLLRANSYATRHFMRTKNVKPQRRVDMIMHHYAIKHKERCWDLYPELVATAMQKLNGNSLTSIKALTTNEMGSGISMLKSEKIFSTIRELSKEDTDREYLQRQPTGKGNQMAVNEKKLKELFKRYIYEPCKELDDHVGKEYLDVIIFDGFLLDADEYNNHSADPKYKEFLFNIESLKTCRKVVSGKQAIKKLLVRQVETAVC